MSEPLGQTDAALSAARRLTHEVDTWRRLCRDALRALSAQHPQEDGLPVDPRAVFAQDLLYITVERALVTRLRGQSIEALERFQRLNRELFARVILRSEPEEALLPALRAYHHFFDGVDAQDPLVIARHAALDGHAAEGDRINASFDDDGEAQVRRFRRILLTRKRLFLDELLVCWQVGFQSADNPERTLRHWAQSPLQGGVGGLGESLLQTTPTWLSRIRRFVTDHMDYDHDWMRDTLRRAHASTPPQVRSPGVIGTTLSRYRDALKNIKGVNDDLERLLAKAGTFERLSLDQIDKFNELQAERSLNQQIAEVSAKQMPLLSTIGKNITDFKAGDAALKSLALIGQSSALAALGGMKQALTGTGHRVDWGEIGREALIDLAQVGGMIAVSLLFGPGAGGLAAGLIGSLFRGKSPDPHEERFKALDTKLDRVLDRISALEDAVMARLNALPGQIRSVVVEERFRAAVAALSDQLGNIQRRHEELFSGRRRHLYGVDLHAEVQGMRDNLQSLVRALWCDGFVLDPRLVAEQAQARWEQEHHVQRTIPRVGETAPPPPALLRPTAGSVIVTLTRGANHEGHAQRFEHTIEAIHALAQLIAELGEAYSKAVEHLVSTFGASLVLPGPTPPAAAWVQARDLERLVEEDLQVLLWVGAELLRAPGERNLALYTHLAPCREDWKNLDPFRGFWLREPREGRLWSYEAKPGGDDDAAHLTTWAPLQEADPRHRLFIVPDGGAADKPYSFVTAASTRQTATARLALGLDDTLTLHTGAQTVSVTFDTVASAGELGSVEAAVTRGVNVAAGTWGDGQPQILRYALDAPDSWLTLICDPRTLRASVEVQIGIEKYAEYSEHSRKTPIRTIPLLCVSLDDPRVSAVYRFEQKRQPIPTGPDDPSYGKYPESPTLRWVIGREDSGHGPVGPVTVALEVTMPADDEHPAPWTQIIEAFSLSPARATNLVPAEGAYDIPVRFQQSDREVVVLFDNLTAFLPKDYLLRGQSLPGGGYLMDPRGEYILKAQQDRNLVVYRDYVTRDEDGQGPERVVEQVIWSAGTWLDGGKDGGALTLTQEGALEQRKLDGETLWQASRHDVKRGPKSWSVYRDGEATRLVVSHGRARLKNARGQDCLIFHGDELKHLK